MNNLYESFGIFRFFALDEEMAILAQSDTVGNVESFAWKFRPGINVVCFYISLTLLATHLASIAVSFKYSTTPLFVFIATVPFLVIPCTAAIPLGITGTPKPTFQAIRNPAFSFFRQADSITWATLSSTFLGEFAKLLTLLFWEGLSFIPASHLFPRFPFADAIMVKELRYAGYGRTKLMCDCVNTKPLFCVELLECPLVRQDRALGRTTMSSRYSIFPEPVIDRLYRRDTGNVRNFLTRHFVCYIQILKCVFVKHFSAFSNVF